MVEHRRPARTPRRQLVVVSRQRVLRPHRPHRDGIRGIAGRRDAAKHRPPVLGLPAVARRRHHHEARLHRTLHRLAQRVVAPALGHVGAERQVHDADAELVLVGDRPVDGLHHGAHLAKAVLVEHLQVDQVRARRHARRALRLALRHGLPRHDARHVRAVAVLVDPAPLRVREVHARHHLAPDGGVRRDAGVDHRDAHAAARRGAQPRGQAAPHVLGARHRRRHAHVRADVGVGRQGIHLGVGRQLLERAGRHLEHGAPAQGLLHQQAVARRDALQAGRGPGDDDVHRPGVAGRQPLGQIRRHPGTAALGLDGKRQRQDRAGQDDERDRPAGRRDACAAAGIPTDGRKCLRLHNHPPNSLGGVRVEPSWNRVETVSVPEHVLRQGFEKHALRAAEGAHRAQTALANAVVHGPARHPQQLRGVVDGHAPSKLRWRLEQLGTVGTGLHAIATSALPHRTEGAAAHGVESNSSNWLLCMGLFARMQSRSGA